MGLKELTDNLEGLVCAFCVSCRQDTMSHKEFLSFWHDKFAIQGYDIINEIYQKLELLDNTLALFSGHDII